MEDQVPAGGARGHAAVVGVKGHAGHLFFMVLQRQTQIIVHPLSRCFRWEDSYFEGAVQLDGLQVPDVDTVIQTPADQEMRRGAQAHTGLLFLSTQTDDVKDED